MRSCGLSWCSGTKGCSSVVSAENMPACNSFSLLKRKRKETSAFANSIAFTDRLPTVSGNDEPVPALETGRLLPEVILPLGEIDVELEVQLEAAALRTSKLFLFAFFVDRAA